MMFYQFTFLQSFLPHCALLFVKLFLQLFHTDVRNHITVAGSGVDLFAKGSVLLFPHPPSLHLPFILSLPSLETLRNPARDLGEYCELPSGFGWNQTAKRFTVHFKLKK